MKISKQTTIKGLLKEYPDVAEILMSYGLHCVGCHFSEFDTLEDGSTMHGLSDEDIDLMIKDVISVVKSKV